MRRFLYALTLAMSLPAIVWQPRPVRAATPDGAAQGLMLVTELAGHR